MCVYIYFILYTLYSTSLFAGLYVGILEKLEELRKIELKVFVLVINFYSLTVDKKRNLLKSDNHFNNNKHGLSGT